MKSSAEEDDLEQTQTNLSLKVPSSTSLPLHQGILFPGKLQPGTSALPTPIYEQTRKLCRAVFRAQLPTPFSSVSERNDKGI